MVRKLRDITLYILLFVLAVHPHRSFAEGEAGPPELQAEAGILMEAQSGQVLYSRNPDQPMYPASITKILTGIIAVESGRLNEVVTVSKNAVHAGGTRVYLEEGEQKPLIDLVYGMIINSGNDAAVAVAEHLGGSVEKFSAMMNEKARELGATNSHFVNPSGMPDEDHVTTARDMALISRYAMQNATFREIVGTKEYPWEGESWQPGHIVNHNRLLWEYDGATGVKNGYTEDAQQTFVATSERNGQQLIAVLLKVPGSADNMYRDLTTLMDYGHESFATHRLTVDEDSLAGLTVEGKEVTGQFKEDNYYITLPKGASVETVEQDFVLRRVTLPIEKGEEIGGIQLTFDNEVLKSIPVIAANSVAAVSAGGEEETELAGFPWMLWFISLLVAFWCLLYFRKQWKQRRRVRARFRDYRSYRG